MAFDLIPGQYYHIYNRGNNRENLFKEAKNYPYFLKLYSKHVERVASTFAYCLLRNHFHFFVRIKTEEEQIEYHEQLSRESGVHNAFKPIEPYRGFGNCFNAYAKAINNQYGRTGSLFEKRFEREWVDSDRYRLAVVAYIHRNPQNHRFVADFRDWKWSSYQTILSGGKTKIRYVEVLDWFEGVDAFVDFHSTSDSDFTLFEDDES